LAEGSVRELSRRPPEMRFWGASVSHAVKCLGEGHRVISVPIFGEQFERGVWRDAVDLRQIDSYLGSELNSF
jgi:hypothetical protein